MILRIKSTDFSCFAGYRSKKYNTELDKYIDLYKNNEDINSFQIESDHNSLSFEQVCYIREKLKENKMFTKIDFDDDGDPIRYWLCFHK